MKGGGHGQSNIEFLEKNNVDYNINKVYENGVRVGNVPGHKVKAKEQVPINHGFQKAGQSLILQQQVLRLLNCPDLRIQKMVWLFLEV